ncbi:hypothetical protein GMSM_40590 [Geomonas sp. Red276]
MPMFLAETINRQFGIDEKVRQKEEKRWETSKGSPARLDRSSRGKGNINKLQDLSGNLDTR